MNYWEKEQKYRLDFVNEMIRYAENINPDHESAEFAAALETWVKISASKFKDAWHCENSD